MYIGNHLSASKGYAAMGRMAVKLGANTFAFFTRQPSGGAAKAIDTADVEKLLELMREQQFGKLVAHAPYTMNLCAAKEDIRKFSKEMIADDLRRMEYMLATASSAAADGVGALKSATKSAIVKSVSCPTAEIIGSSES